ncbi:MAG TPA: protein phosphatase 2C domain-containing protein [Streptosporangiaceae bacterium]|nr:protein phosphatase 2C domain-containing protein [Streptosporangiaceae bacterium]
MPGGNSARSDPGAPAPDPGAHRARRSPWPQGRPAEARAARKVPDVPPAAADAETAGPWAPIVVGEPVFEFEPKPPARGPYRPDTVFDGWSTRRLSVRLASVRGYSHRYSGIPRQDDAQAACHARSGAICFAVADGLSSAARSHIGAAAACQSAVDLMIRQLSAGGPKINWMQLVEDTVSDLASWASYILNQDHVEPADVEAQLATTLVAGYVLPTAQGAVTSMIQIGDSSAWLLRGGKYYPVLAEKNDPGAQVISSAVSPLPRIPAVIKPAEFRMPPDSVLLAGSDGFGDPLGDGSGMVGQLFARHLASPLPPRALAHLLDFSRETFDDDRTLVALWQRPPEPGGT